MTDRALLFLDIDGVLHSSFGRQHLLRQLPVLEAWLRERPRVDIVITSTWRQRRKLGELTELVSPKLRDRIVGVTPVIEADLHEAPPMYVRQAEVTAWLRANAPPGGTWDRWAALDDSHWLYPPFTPHLVAIRDATVGVTAVELAQLDKLLDFSR